MCELVETKPIAGQQPGTSELRAKSRVFMQPGYLENFIQSGFNELNGVTGSQFCQGHDPYLCQDRQETSVLPVPCQVIPVAWQRL